MHKNNLSETDICDKFTRVTALCSLRADLRQRLAERKSVHVRLVEALVGAVSLSSEPC